MPVRRRSGESTEKEIAKNKIELVGRRSKRGRGQRDDERVEVVDEEPARSVVGDESVLDTCLVAAGGFGVDAARVHTRGRVQLLAFGGAPARDAVEAPARDGGSVSD